MSTPNPAPPAAALSGARWRKSSYSGGANDCVEIAAPRSTTETKRAIRDSKDPQGPVLIVTVSAFAAFIRGIERQ
ncbi:DUF397 domain-containing protein [Streptomyces sp. NPDC087903]|uniref:DUF397 domain-containing protein n=1 Tax=Streptomyces sp. NPDC087903 TaxID=3365819 RepID=UPI003818F5B7